MWRPQFTTSSALAQIKEHVMKQLWLALLIACLGLAPAQAQQVTNPQPNAGTYAAYNTVLPTCVNGSGCWLQTDLNGNLKIAIASGGGSGGTASTFGAAFPATGTAVGFTDGTNMVSGRVRNPGSGALTTDAAIVVVDPNVLAAVQAAIPAGTNTIGTVGQLPYPVGAVPITASATGTTAATTATLAGAVGKTTYICSLSVRANATANANVTDTVTGVITGTLSRALWVPANTAGLGVDEMIYNPCVPASATNTAIAVVSGAPGTGGVVTVNATGYQL